MILHQVCTIRPSLFLVRRFFYRTMSLQRGDGYGNNGIHAIPNNTKAVLIFMHGLGDTANGWTDFIEMLRRRPEFQQTKFILPTAPTRKISINGGFPMPGWADIMGLSPVDPEDENGYNESVMRIHKIINTEIENGINPNKIIVGGFSQGGATAYLSTLSYPKQLGGVIAFSSWLPLMKQNPAKFSSINHQTLKTPILHCHGTSDQIVDYKWGKATVEELKSIGFKVQFKSYDDMGHSVCDGELSDAADFISKVYESSS